MELIAITKNLILKKKKNVCFQFIEFIFDY